MSMNLPKSIQDVVDGFSGLPGIGPKTAQRLAFYMLRMPKDEVFSFAEAIEGIKTNSHICERCHNVGDGELCEVCNDESRDSTTLCVVESPLDLLAIEKSGYKGTYHVLHGVLNPIAGIGPEEIFVGQLFPRLEKLVQEYLGASSYSSLDNKMYSDANVFSDSDQDDENLSEKYGTSNVSNVREVQSNIEVIIATGLSLEGESTAMYIQREISRKFDNAIRVSRIGRGLPVGADILYADDRTLGDALQGRIQY